MLQCTINGALLYQYCHTWWHNYAGHWFSCAIKVIGLYDKNNKERIVFEHRPWHSDGTLLRYCLVTAGEFHIAHKIVNWALEWRTVRKDMIEIQSICVTITYVIKHWSDLHLITSHLCKDSVGSYIRRFNIYELLVYWNTIYHTLSTSQPLRALMYTGFIKSRILLFFSCPKKSNKSRWYLHLLNWNLTKHTFNEWQKRMTITINVTCLPP